MKVKIGSIFELDWQAWGTYLKLGKRDWFFA